MEHGFKIFMYFFKALAGLASFALGVIGLKKTFDNEEDKEIIFKKYEKYYDDEAE